MPTAIFDRTFQAAHRLLNHDGKCSRIHGHNFEVAMHIETDFVGEDGFVVEFDHVKQLIDAYDHRLILNEDDDLRLGDPADETWYVHVPGDPTTEFMAQYLAHELAIMVRRKNERAGAIRVHVTLRETESIAAMGVAHL